MDINLEWYKVFYHVAKERQFSKAAKSLFITQPAVSQSIKLLEKSIGGELFLRTSKGVLLTSEGKELFKYVEKALILIKNGESQFNQLRNLEIGVIKIGASDTLCSHYLILHLKNFRDTYPNIKIQVFNKTTYEIIDSLKSGEIDLGFINLPIIKDSVIEVVNVKSLQDCFICGKKYKDSFVNRVNLKELTNFPLLMLEEGTNMRKFVDEYFKDNNLTYSPELELGSINILTKFAIEGFGISFVTKNFVSNEIKNKEVFVIDVKEEIPSRSIGMIKMKHRNLTNASRSFYERFI